MNIEDFETTPETDLHRFLKFLKGIETSYNPHISVEKEDWNNMCGITVKQSFSGKDEHICFNFYEDGKFRVIIRDD